MSLEIEQKFVVEDVGRLEAQLSEVSAVSRATQDHCDRYFRHPSRDFKATNEALRIRRIGDENHVTYKGPIVDSVVKAREEIEIPFRTGESSNEQLATMLTRLGFTESLSVRKQRRPFDLEWQSRRMEIVIDEVDGLGTYAEIETIAEEVELPAAREAVTSLAARLGLTDLERRSYLSMLLER